MDYFRYTHVGASHVLKAAGLAVRSVHLVGGSELTSAWLLGFGSGDMQPPQLDDASILHEVDRRNMSKPSDELFMAVGLLARKSGVRNTMRVARYYNMRKSF